MNAKELMKLAQEDVSSRFKLYKQLSELDCNKKEQSKKQIKEGV